MTGMTVDRNAKPEPCMVCKAENTARVLVGACEFWLCPPHMGRFCAGESIDEMRRRDIPRSKA